LDTVSKNSEFKVNPEQYAELKPVSGIYETPVVREVEHVQEVPLNDEVSEENSIAPANDAIEAKSDRSMESDSPALIESTNATQTFTTTSSGNLSVPAAQWTTDEKVNVIVTDSVKIQNKKKKKTPPKKK
jgi:pantothenate kinase